MGGFIYNRNNNINDNNYINGEDSLNEQNNDEFNSIKIKYKINYYYIKIFGSKFVKNNKKY